MAKKVKSIDEITADFEQATNIAAKKFADKETGKIYKEGDSLDHLDEKRILELKARGFINDKS